MRKMRAKKTLSKDEIAEVYGNWDGVKANHKVFSHIHTVYYYRFDGRSDGVKWFPTTRENLVKRGIIKDA